MNLKSIGFRNFLEDDEYYKTETQKAPSITTSEATSNPHREQEMESLVLLSFLCCVRERERKRERGRIETKKLYE